MHCKVVIKQAKLTTQSKIEDRESNIYPHTECSILYR